MVQVELKGMLSPDFAGMRAPVMVFPEQQSPEYRRANPPVEVHDARRLQSSAKSESAFFSEHGFVLLPHQSAVKNWDEDIASIYRGEIAAIVRERLLPGRKVAIQQAPKVMRRGQQMRFYGEAVHSDGPLTPQAHAANVGAVASPQAEAAWLQSFASDNVAGFMLIGFWRTTEMSGPLRHMPLALCDPNSLDRSDLIPNSIANIAPRGQRTEHLALRFNPKQRWYYYPEMTTDEVLAFKLCEYLKDDPDAPPQNVFHSAFQDPDAPSDCERRQSCEHRASVMILRD